MNFILEPLAYSFMLKGLAAVFLIGLTCAVIGVFVVLRRMAFVGDAMAHTALPGLVTAYLSGWNLFAGSVIAGVLTAFGISWFSRREGVREDTAIGVLFTGMFAFGILLMSTIRSFKDFNHMLFGNILGISDLDLLLLGLTAFVVLGTLLIFHKELVLTSFDPTHARVMGINADRLRTLLLILLALTVTTGIQGVGVILTSALLVTPAAAASLLTRNLGKMMILSGVFALLSGVTGLYLSYWFNLASGAAIVLTATLLFLLSWVIRGFQSRKKTL